MRRGERWHLSPSTLFPLLLQEVTALFIWPSLSTPPRLLPFSFPFVSFPLRPATLKATAAAAAFSLSILSVGGSADSVVVPNDADAGHDGEAMPPIDGCVLL